MKTFLTDFLRATACPAVVVLFIIPAEAQDWLGQDPGNNDFNGVFGQDANWSGGQTPGDSDTAVFEIAGETYTVSFDDAAETHELQIRKGSVTFDFNNWNYLINDDSRNTPVLIGDTSGGESVKLTLLNGHLDVAGGLHLRGSSIPATLEIGSGGSLETGNWLQVGNASGGVGELIIRDGGAITDVGNLFIGNRSAGSGTGSVIVTGPGSRIGPSGTAGGIHANVNVAAFPDDHGTLLIEKGASLNFNNTPNNRDLNIGTGAGSTGIVTVTGEDSTFATTRAGTFIGHETDSSGTAILEIFDDGRVFSPRNEVEIRPHGMVDIRVTGDNMFNINNNNGDLINDGLIRLTADPRLAADDYSPLTVAGSWSGTGTVQTFGGVFDQGTEIFAVAAAEEADSGDPVNFDLATTQRLQVSGSGGEQLLLAFDPSSQATGGGSTIDFTATVNSLGTIGNFEVLGAWDFDTDLAPVSTTMLSMDVGSDVAVDLFAWHSPDGINWSRLDTRVFREEEWASIFVTGFSSYAITIPEPSSAVLMLLVGATWLAGRCRPRHSNAV